MCVTRMMQLNCACGANFGEAKKVCGTLGQEKSSCRFLRNHSLLSGREGTARGTPSPGKIIVHNSKEGAPSRPCLDSQRSTISIPPGYCAWTKLTDQ